MEDALIKQKEITRGGKVKNSFICESEMQILFHQTTTLKLFNHKLFLPNATMTRAI